MARTPNLSQWYCEDVDLNRLSEPFEPAKVAFKQALETFEKKTLAKDPRKRHRLERVFGASTTELCHVLGEVAAAQQHYANKHAGSKAHRCVNELSKRICYYGNIMDVLVQHHPEYVSLAWGAFKLLFGAVAEHENVATTIFTGLCSIADALPRVELATILYPTNTMKQLVAIVYANIMKFLVRALEWYEEGKIAHAIHAITRPAALRYDDLLQDIERATRSIAELATASSQAEQRVMHEELCAIRTAVDGTIAVNEAEQRSTKARLIALTDAVEQLRIMMQSNHCLDASAHIEMRHVLSDIQLKQALNTISRSCNVDHESSFQASLRLRDRRRYGSCQKCVPFWNSSEMHTWNTAQQTSVVHFKSAFRDRHCVQDFRTNVIEQLVKAHIAVLWVIKGSEQISSVSEILKSLIIQALYRDRSSHTDLALLFQVRKYFDITSENDYVNFLAEILQHFRLVYIVVANEGMDFHITPQFCLHLENLSQRFCGEGSKTTLKIIMLSHRPDGFYQTSKNSSIVKIPRVSRRKGQKLPKKPLQILDTSSRSRNIRS
ncbi:hypothetical protein MMC27_001775 [Xylographa pallens]|nr:hypothetical protein [Xylographa pallens]